MTRNSSCYGSLDSLIYWNDNDCYDLFAFFWHLIIKVLAWKNKNLLQ